MALDPSNSSNLEQLALKGLKMEQVLQQEAYPVIQPYVDAQNSVISGAIAFKVGESLSDMWPNRCAKFHADRYTVKPRLRNPLPYKNKKAQ